MHGIQNLADLDFEGSAQKTKALLRQAIERSVSGARVCVKRNHYQISEPFATAKVLHLFLEEIKNKSNLVLDVDSLMENNEKEVLCN